MKEMVRINTLESLSSQISKFIEILQLSWNYILCKQFEIPCSVRKLIHSINMLSMLFQIFNWKPKPFNNTEDLPGNMPEDLKQHIKMVVSILIVNFMDH